MAKKRNKNIGVDALSNAVGGGEGLTRQDRRERRQAAREMKKKDKAKEQAAEATPAVPPSTPTQPTGQEIASDLMQGEQPSAPQIMGTERMERRRRKEAPKQEQPKQEDPYLFNQSEMVGLNPDSNLGANFAEGFQSNPVGDEQLNQAEEESNVTSKLKTLTEAVTKKGKDAIRDVIATGNNVMSQLSLEDINATVDDLTQSVYDKGYATEDERSRIEALAQMALGKRAGEAEAPTGKLTYQDYFPTGGRPIAVGSYSRKTLGSGNIYAAEGFTIPMGMIDARTKAIDDAAKERAKTVGTFLETQFGQVPEQYQRQMDNMNMDYLQKYGELVDYDYSILLDPSNPISMEFKKEGMRLKAIRDQANRMETIVNDLFAKDTDKSGAYYIDKDTYAAMTAWRQGSRDLEKFSKSGEFGKIAKELYAYNNLVYDAGQVAGKISKDDYDKFLIDPNNITDPKEVKKLKDAYKKIASGANQNKRAAAFLTVMDRDRIREMANGLMENRRYGDKTLEDVETYLASLFGSQISTDKFTQQHDALKAKKQAFEQQQKTKILSNFYNRFDTDAQTILNDSKEGKIPSKDYGSFNPNMKKGDVLLAEKKKKKGETYNATLGDDTVLVSFQGEKTRASDVKYNGRAVKDMSDDEIKQAPLNIRGQLFFHKYNNPESSVGIKVDKTQLGYRNKGDGTQVKFGEDVNANQVDATVSVYGSGNASSIDDGSRYLIAYDTEGEIVDVLQKSDGTHTTALGADIQAFRDKNVGNNVKDDETTGSLAKNVPITVSETFTGKGAAESLNDRLYYGVQDPYGGAKTLVGTEQTNNQPSSPTPTKERNHPETTVEAR